LVNHFITGGWGGFDGSGGLSSGLSGWALLILPVNISIKAPSIVENAPSAQVIACISLGS
jgi:hypothetical protein